MGGERNRGLFTINVQTLVVLSSDVPCNNEYWLNYTEIGSEMAVKQPLVPN